MTGSPIQSPWNEKLAFSEGRDSTVSIKKEGYCEDQRNPLKDFRYK